MTRLRRTAASAQIARMGRTAFVRRKRSVLRLVANEQLTKHAALAALDRLYDRQTREYLRTPSATYADWLEHGPRDELVEVREASLDDAIWDRLVDRAAMALLD